MSGNGCNGDTTRDRRARRYRVEETPPYQAERPTHLCEGHEGRILTLSEPVSHPPFARGGKFTPVPAPESRLLSPPTEGGAGGGNSGQSGRAANVSGTTPLQRGAIC